MRSHRRVRRSVVLAVVLAVASVSPVQGQVNTSIHLTSKDCVSPSGWESCRNRVSDTIQLCVTACDGFQTCILACGCVMYQELFNCVGTDCWNQVYSCEYQGLVKEYFDGCPIAAEPVPFWPPPDNAPAGCSCNTGKVLKGVLYATTEYTQCLRDVTAATTSFQAETANDTACRCCAISSGLSTIYETCPNTIPSLIGADKFLSAVTVGETASFDDCNSTLKSFNCINGLGFLPPSDNSNVFYQPGGFPKNGTETFYNTGSLTTPVSGATFTWTAGATVTYTVKATLPGKYQTAGSGSASPSATGAAAISAKPGEGAWSGFRIQGWMVFLVAGWLGVLY